MSRNFRLLIVGIWLLLCGGNGFAQGDRGEVEFRAFDDVFVEPGGLADTVRHRVLYFANFGCPFCQEAHQYLPQWANSLPPPYEFEVVPAVALKEHGPMAVAYYVVLVAEPQRIGDFEVALYRQLVTNGRSAWDAGAYRSAAAAAGISAEDFDRLARSPLVARYVERAHQLTLLYGVEEVPTVVVANRYRTNPGRVQGDQATFIKLLNGLVSMHHAEFVR